jgi:hypothetical protein
MLHLTAGEGIFCMLLSTGDQVFLYVTFNIALDS